LRTDKIDPYKKVSEKALSQEYFGEIIAYFLKFEVAQQPHCTLFGNYEYTFFGNNGAQLFHL
jgi:hypothetical protein